MSATVLYMSMSVDGYIAGPNESRENGLGDGGERLHEWVFGKHGVVGADRAADRLTGVDRDVWDDMMSTGAVLAGRGTFEPADGWGGDHHDGVPIFILSRHPVPPEFAGYPLVHYVSDLQGAVRDARAAAGERNVLVHGAGVAQRLLRAGLLDEIQLHQVPVLLGQGRRLFESLPAKHIELEPVQALKGAEALHLRYRVSTMAQSAN